MRLLHIAHGEIENVWPEVEPLLQRVIDKAVKGEFTAQDILEMAKKGHAHICVVREGERIVLAFAFEFRNYPQALAINIFAFGGRRLHECADIFFERLKQFCRSAGAEWIECLCSPAMARMLHRNGFHTAYQGLRLDLQEGAKNDFQQT